MSGARKRIYVRKTAPILAAAERLFLSRGFEPTSMQEVATAAGVAKATLYSNFPNKEVLFEAVIRNRAESSQLDISHIDLSSRDIRTVLLELGCAFLQDIYSREQVELFQTVVSDSRRFPLLGKMMIEEAFVETHGKIKTYLADRIAAGDLIHDDADMAAEYFIAIIKAAKHIPLVFNQAKTVTPQVIRRIVKGAVAIYLDGVPHPGQRPRAAAAGSKGKKQPSPRRS